MLAETGVISYSFDEFTIDGRTTLVVRGWAFVNGHDSENSAAYMVLESTSQTRIFDTHAEERPDVTRHFVARGHIA